MKNYNVKQIAKAMQKWNNSEIEIINDDEAVIDGFNVTRTMKHVYNDNTHCYHKEYTYKVMVDDKYIYEMDGKLYFNKPDDFDQDCYGLKEFFKNTKEMEIDQLIYQYELKPAYFDVYYVTHDRSVDEAEYNVYQAGSKNSFVVYDDEFCFKVMDGAVWFDKVTYVNGSVVDVEHVEECGLNKEWIAEECGEEVLYEIQYVKCQLNVVWNNDFQKCWVYEKMI